MTFKHNSVSDVCRRSPELLTHVIMISSRWRSIFLLLLHLDDIINIGVVTNIEAAKYINAPTLSTANTPPPPLKYIQSEVIHPPPSNVAFYSARTVLQVGMGWSS